MIQRSIQQWLGASLLGSILVLGCSHTPRQKAPYASSYPAAPMAGVSGYVPRSVIVMHDPAAPQAMMVPRDRMPETLPAVASVPSTGPKEEEGAKGSAEKEEGGAKGSAEKKAADKTSSAEKDLMQTSYAVTGAKVDSIQRRSFADITAKPCFAHAEDYSWLKGQLLFCHARNCWRVRYASCEEEDRYGGSVTLADIGRMTGFTSGQLVRVEGFVVNPDSREPSPAYRVRSLQPLNGK